MGKLLALLNVFRKGSAVADVVKAKNWSALAGTVGTLIFTVSQFARGFGYDLGIDNDTAERIGVGIAAVAGVFVTYATSDKVGLPAKPVQPDVQTHAEADREAP